MLSFEFLLRLSAILKLDFLKSPAKSSSARPPRGMKLGNVRQNTNNHKKIAAQSLENDGKHENSKISKLKLYQCRLCFKEKNCGKIWSC